MELNLDDYEHINIKGDDEKMLTVSKDNIGMTLEAGYDYKFTKISDDKVLIEYKGD